jgi:hypothetical protein
LVHYCIVDEEHGDTFDEEQLGISVLALVGIVVEGLDDLLESIAD